MRIFRIATTLLGALALSAVFSTATQAAPPYPPGPPQLTSNESTVPDHGDVTLHGTGYDPHELVEITERDRPIAAGAPRAIRMVPAAYRMPASAVIVLATVRADAAGNFTVQVQLNHSGMDTLSAIGETSGMDTSITELVLPVAGAGGGGQAGGASGGQAGGGGGLPRTGSDLVPVAAVGGSLIAVGLVLLVTTRTRRRGNGRGTRGTGSPGPIG